MLSPSGLTSVCSGRELTLLCSTNRSYIRWNVTISLQSGKRESRSQLLSSSSQNIAPLIVGTKSFVITANATNILTSTLTIANVTDLNGTTVRCTDIGTSSTETSTSVAMVHVIKVTGIHCIVLHGLFLSGTNQRLYKTFSLSRVSIT